MAHEVWAEIDARHPAGDFSPLEVVAGLPILVRIVKQARALGWFGARVIVQTSELERVKRAIDRARIPAPFLIEYDVGDVALATPGGEAAGGGKRTTVVLDGRALYERDLLAEAADSGLRVAPEMLIRSRAQADIAQRRLLAKTKKNLILDGVVAYFVMRPASRVITRALVNTPVSQHLVTMLALATGVCGGWFASHGDAGSVMLAGILYFCTGIFDCVDGDLARIRLAPSRLGAWLDSLTDEAVTFSLVLGLGAGLAAAGAGSEWRTLSLVIFGMGVVTLSKMYADLSRLRLPIDTAMYPWFFLGDVDPESAYPPKGFGGKLLFALGFVIRRDANVTIIAALLVLGRPKIALVAIGVVLSAVTLLLLTHVIVQTRRKIANP